MEKQNFTDYYKQAYQKVKNTNIQLASQAASKEQSVLELRQKYERIAGNPVARFFYKLKGLPAKWKEGGKTVLKDSACGESSVSVKRYEKNLLFQKEPYQYWIGEHESAVHTDRTVDVIRENMMEKYGVTENESKTEIIFMEDCKASFSLEQTQKSYLLFVTKQGRIGRQALQRIDSYFEKYPHVSLIYGGEDRIEKTPEGGESRKKPWFKPAYSPDTLLSYFYFGNVFAVRKESYSSVPWLGSDNYRENIYDFVLKAEELSAKDREDLNPTSDMADISSAGNTGNIGRMGNGEEKIAALGEILFHGTEKEDKTTLVMDETAIEGVWGYEKEYEKIKLDALRRRGIRGYLEEGNIPGVDHVCFEAKGKVSVIILSKDHPEILEKCIRSVLEKTDYPDMEIIVVDNGSYETNRIRSEELGRTYGFRYICEPMDFNFSAMCNIGAKEAKGEYLLLLNDDIEVIESGYMKRMAGQASVSGVGAVGAKLWYPDGLTIQHTGITNLSIGPAHKLTGAWDDRMYYDGRNVFTFNYLAVTGACLMVRKELYEKVGGMDEDLPVAYNDVAFCLKLHKAGYRNVLRNDAILLHHESLSRGLDEKDQKKAARLLKEKKKLYRRYPEYEGYDPYYSPWLTQNSPEYRCGSTFECQRDEVKKPITEKILKKDAKALKEKQLVFFIDEARVMQEEEETPAESMSMVQNHGVMRITGWSVLRDADNCHYKRSLLLEEAEGKKLYATEIMSYLREDVAELYGETGGDVRGKEAGGAVGEGNGGKRAGKGKRTNRESRIELSGLVARFRLKTVKKGRYRVGVLYEDMLSDRMYYRISDRIVEI